MGQWSELSAQEKAQIIKFAIDNGVSDIKTIRDTYNMYDDEAHKHEGESSDSQLHIPTREEYITQKLDSIRSAALEKARQTHSDNSVRIYETKPERARENRENLARELSPIKTGFPFHKENFENILNTIAAGDFDRAYMIWHNHMMQTDSLYKERYEEYQEALANGDKVEVDNCIANLSRF